MSFKNNIEIERPQRIPKPVGFYLARRMSCLLLASRTKITVRVLFAIRSVTSDSSSLEQSESLNLSSPICSLELIFPLLRDNYLFFILDSLPKFGDPISVRQGCT